MQRIKVFHFTDLSNWRELTDCFLNYISITRNWDLRTTTKCLKKLNRTKVYEDIYKDPNQGLQTVLTKSHRKLLLTSIKSLRFRFLIDSKSKNVINLRVSKPLVNAHISRRFRSPTKWDTCTWTFSLENKTCKTWRKFRQ